MIIAGIDEAGRGPCVGPMVLAVACIEKKDEEKLREIGVRDSKLLSPKQREKLFTQIHGIASEIGAIEVSAKEIDTLRDWKSLNEVEAMRIGLLLNALKVKPEIVFVDSPDIIEGNFAERIKKYISFKTIIRAEHKADYNYPIVGAASIVAKVRRDLAIVELEKIYGKIGSGYPHDESTIKFLKNFLQQNNELPEIVRKSWLTTQRIMNERFQQKII